MKLPFQWKEKKLTDIKQRRGRQAYKRKYLWKINRLSNI